MSLFKPLVMTGVLMAVQAVSASAQSPEAAAPTAYKGWVSGTGVDSGTCQLAAPCKTFAYALTQVAAGGEIDVKDSGSYGPVVITKSISIVAPDGVLATITTPATTDAVAIKSGSNDVVLLRGITIDGHRTRTIWWGINVGSPTNVTIDHCIVKGNDDGIVIANTGAHVILTNNIVFGNQTLGISVSGNAVLGGNIVSDNGVGFTGSAYSFGDNKIRGNISSDIDANSQLTYVGMQ